MSTRFGLRIVENCFEKAFGKVGSDFQNLRLGSINFARWLQKIVAIVMRCVGFSGMLLSFCNNFAIAKTQQSLVVINPRHFQKWFKEHSSKQIKCWVVPSQSAKSVTCHGRILTKTYYRSSLHTSYIAKMPVWCFPGQTLTRNQTLKSQALLQGCECLIWATNSWKVLRKRILKGLWRSDVCPAFQNLRLGSINFARWLQKIVATCDAMCWFLGMLWSFVTTLQDDYKR